MAEYIEKETVIANLMEQIEKGRDTAECEATELVIKRFAEYISSFPATDVQPVKHGKWEYYKNNGIYDTYKCSICKESLELPMDADISQEIRYCPNCGARMDGDTE